MTKTCVDCGTEIEYRSTRCHPCAGKKRRTRVEVACEKCGELFEVQPHKLKAGHGRFCSLSCKAEWQSRNLVGENNPLWRRIERACEWCGESFLIKRYVVENGNGKYCSKSCMGQAQALNRCGENNGFWKGGQVERQCEICGDSFFKDKWVIEKGWGRFCSIKCKSIWMSQEWRGEDAPNWKGGISDQPYPLEFNEALRSAVRNRDGNTCQMCGGPENGRALDVHHIDYCKRHNDATNLVSLCISCHAKMNVKRGYWRALLTNRIGA